jgi:hypothetical protein
MARSGLAIVHKAVRWHGAWYGVPGVDEPENRDETQREYAGSTSKTLMETGCDGTKR